MRKVALITGASGGIGGELARTFANAGYDLALTYNTNQSAVDTLVSQIKDKYHVEAIAYQVDLSKDSDIERIVTDICRDYGRVDVLINNAAMSIDRLFGEKTSTEFRQTLDVNVVGVFTLSRYIGDMMHGAKSGSIINISSTNGINTYYPMCVDYDASKSALISLSHNLAIQYAPYVRVNVVAPGFIGTRAELDAMDAEFIAAEQEKILTHTIGEPSDVAELCLFLASDKAKFINNTVIRIDGGMYGSV